MVLLSNSFVLYLRLSSAPLFPYCLLHAPQVVASVFPNLALRTWPLKASHVALRMCPFACGPSHVALRMWPFACGPSHVIEFVNVSVPIWANAPSYVAVAIWALRISNLDTPKTLVAARAALISLQHCYSIMSLSYWAQACSAASNKPLQALLGTAYASCGVTVSVGCSC